MILGMKRDIAVSESAHLVHDSIRKIVGFLLFCSKKSLLFPRIWYFLLNEEFDVVEKDDSVIHTDKRDTKAYDDDMTPTSLFNASFDQRNIHETKSSRSNRGARIGKNPTRGIAEIEEQPTPTKNTPNLFANDSFPAMASSTINTDEMSLQRSTTLDSFSPSSSSFVNDTHPAQEGMAEGSVEEPGEAIFDENTKEMNEDISKESMEEVKEQIAIADSFAPSLASFTKTKGAEDENEDWIKEDCKEDNDLRVVNEFDEKVNKASTGHSSSIQETSVDNYDGNTKGRVSFDVQLDQRTETELVRKGDTVKKEEDVLEEEMKDDASVNPSERFLSMFRNASISQCNAQSPREPETVEEGTEIEVEAAIRGGKIGKNEIKVFTPSLPSLSSNGSIVSKAKSVDSESKSIESKTKSVNPSTKSKSAKLKSKSKLKSASSITPQSSSSTTLIKYDHKPLLLNDSDVTHPEVTIYQDNAAVTDDKCLHFFSFKKEKSNAGKWVHSTTVTIENNYCVSVALSTTTAVVGVPYDKHTNGLLVGAAYIFEKDVDKGTWFQVKKIVPKDVLMGVGGGEFASVGYSVSIDGNLIAIGVPHVGNSKLSGAVYVYKRFIGYKWDQKGCLLPEPETKDTIYCSGRGGKGSMIDKSPLSGKKFGSIVAAKGNIVVVSDYHSQKYTHISVYEFHPSLPPNKRWTTLDDNILTEDQSKDFGSHLAMTDNGGILVGCHAKVNPTEVLYFVRKSIVGSEDEVKFQMHQTITVSDSANTKSKPEEIADFKVDGNKLILGTSCGSKHCIYLYGLQEETNKWTLVSKVDDPAIEKFGHSVAIGDGKVLIGGKTNAYFYRLDGMMKEKRKLSIFSSSKRAGDTGTNSPPLHPATNTKTAASFKPNIVTNSIIRSCGNNAKSSHSAKQVKFESSVPLNQVDDNYVEQPYQGSKLKEFQSSELQESQKLLQSQSARLSLSLSRPRQPKWTSLSMRSMSPSKGTKQLPFSP